MRMKTSGELAYGQVPALQVGGKTLLVQTAAILRYVANLAPESGLYPACPIARARVDAVLDQECDMTMGLKVSKYKDRHGFDEATVMNEANTAVVRGRLNEEVLPRHLGNFERMLRDHGPGKWLAGTEQPSIADFALVCT